MTEKEAIKQIRENIALISDLDCTEYEMAISALENQIPKKIIFNSEDDREYEDYICPNCKDILQQRRKGATRITIYKYKFCHNCGQKLDWSD